MEFVYDTTDDVYIRSYGFMLHMTVIKLMKIHMMKY